MPVRARPRKQRPPAGADRPRTHARTHAPAMESRSVWELAYHREWDALLGRLATDEGRGEAREEGVGGQLPLHDALCNGAPEEVVRAHLDAYPEGAGRTDNRGRLPLHVAICKKAPLEVVRALLDAYPQGAQTATSAGYLPLHWAASHSAPLEVVRALLDVHPQGAQTTDNDGSLPLHRAACTRAPVEVVRALLDVHPQGAQTTDIDGQLPLHLAGNKAPLEVVRALLDAHPQGAQTMDRAGRLPLHTAAAFDNRHPQVLLMLALAHAGHPPSRPWTPETCAILRGIDLDRLPEACRLLVRALIDAHVSRVRTLLLALHRLGLPSALAPLLAGAVYKNTADILR